MERRRFHTDSCSHSSWNFTTNTCDCGWLQDLHENGWDIREPNPARPNPEIPRTSGVILSDVEFAEFLRLLAIRAKSVKPTR